MEKIYAELRERITNNAPFKLDATFANNKLKVSILTQVGKKGTWQEQVVPGICDGATVGPFSADIFHFPRAPGKEKPSILETYYDNRIGTEKLESSLKRNYGMFLHRDGAWMNHFPKSDLDRASLVAAEDCVTMGDAICDLPALQPPAKNLKIKDSVRKYRKSPEREFQKWSRGKQKKLHNNITRWHREMEIGVFKNMKQGGKWSQPSKSDRDEIGYSNESFNDKWRRLSNKEPSWTVVSHLSKDGYMYIHPTQNRTVSVREAA